MIRRGKIDYVDACMLLEQAIIDANSPHQETAKFGLKELGDLAKTLQNTVYYQLANQAARELVTIKQRVMVPGVLFNGKPLCLANFPREDLAFPTNKRQKVMASCPTSNRINVPFWAYRRRQYPGPSSL